MIETDRGYVYYEAEKNYKHKYHQYFLQRYKENCKGQITEAFNGITGEPLPQLIGKCPSEKLPEGISAEFIDMTVVRKDNESVRIVRVRGADNTFSYYGTNLPREKVPALAVYLLYRCRREGAEHTFKALQSGDGMQSVNSSCKEIVIAFFLSNILTYLIELRIS